MPVIVSLREVVNEMDVFDDESHAFLNPSTGESATVSTEELSSIEEGYDIAGYPDWQHDAIRKAEEILNSDDWLKLPSKFEIHEWEIMKDFCYSVEDERLSNELLDAIHGSGAFRHFKNTIYHRGIEQDWYRFRQQALDQIAREWLEENKIPYTEA